MKKAAEGAMDVHNLTGRHGTVQQLCEIPQSAHCDAQGAIGTDGRKGKGMSFGQACAGEAEKTELAGSWLQGACIWRHGDGKRTTCPLELCDPV
ncbi:hypothetical protein [uncultured Roseobacter sp.]|uniref:hypothetical protein n=1 Tax=uncultured Roseobacter sp. TaxID=114847 RepID=UPI00261D4525|nr:hypothetical protein [uncultured Roseobacter sp.]